MVEGKISENVLKRSILKEIKVKSDKIITGAAFGEDCAILNCTDNERMGVAVSQGEGVDGARIAVIAADGIEIKFVTVSLMFSFECEEDELKAVERAINEECEKHEASVIGGQSEVNSSSEIRVSSTSLGTPFDNIPLDSSSIKKSPDK